jgi:Na+-driven multidrug efflux pump
VLQIIILPGMAIGFAVGPIAAQNFGAGSYRRVRETFYRASLLTASIMLAIALVVGRFPAAVVSMFHLPDSGAIGTAIVFLRLMSWNFVAQGLVYVCSNMFQGLGNTVPSLVSSATQFTLSSLAVVWLSTEPGFRAEHVWYTLIVCVTLQAALSMLLVRVQFKLRMSTAHVSPKCVEARPTALVARDPGAAR